MANQPLAALAGRADLVATLVLLHGRDGDGVGGGQRGVGPQHVASRREVVLARHRRREVVGPASGRGGASAGRQQHPVDRGPVGCRWLQREVLSVSVHNGATSFGKESLGRLSRTIVDQLPPQREYL